MTQSKQEKKIAELEAKIRMLRGLTGRKRKLIPKPKGLPGRNEKRGYNLCQKMRLLHDKNRYHCLHRIVTGYADEYLPRPVCIREQDQADVEKVIAKIRHEVKFFKRFANGWPIKTIIQVYLLNRSARRKQDLMVEKDAQKEDEQKGDEDDDEEMDNEEEGEGDGSEEEGDGDGSEEEGDGDGSEEEGDGDGSDAEEMEGSDAGEEEGSVAEEGSESEQEEEPVKPRQKTRKHKTVARHDVAETDGEGDEEVEVEVKPAAKKTRKRKTIALQHPAETDGEGNEEAVTPKKNNKRTKTPQQVTVDDTNNKAPSKPTKRQKRDLEGMDNVEDTSSNRKQTKSAKRKKIDEVHDLHDDTKQTKKPKLSKASQDKENNRPPSQKVDHARQASLPAKSKRKQVLFDDNKDDSDDNDNTPPPPVQPLLPNVCPEYGCSDTFPTSPSPTLLSLFSYRQKLIADHGRRRGEPKGLYVNSLEICEQIKKDDKRPELHDQGVAAGWPSKSDLDDAWEGMVKRVERMAPEIFLLFDGDEEALEESAPWDEILSYLAGLTEGDDDPQPITLANVAANRMLQGSLRSLGRPGYFGPMGTMFITSMCMRLFPEGIPIPEVFQPLSHSQVIEFIIVPHIATNLIAQASEVTHLTAHYEMLASVDYGEMFHHDLDDPILYKIHQDNMRSIRNIERKEQKRRQAEDPTATVSEFYDGIAQRTRGATRPKPSTGKKSKCMSSRHLFLRSFYMTDDWYHRI